MSDMTLKSVCGAERRRASTQLLFAHCSTLIFISASFVSGFSLSVFCICGNSFSRQTRMRHVSLSNKCPQYRHSNCCHPCCDVDPFIEEPLEPWNGFLNGKEVITTWKCEKNRKLHKLKCHCCLRTILWWFVSCLRIFIFWTFYLYSKVVESPRRRANPPPIDRIGMSRLPNSRG